MTIKIEFPANNLALAAAIGAALTNYGHGGGVAPFITNDTKPEPARGDKKPTVDELAAEDMGKLNNVGSASGSTTRENPSSSETSTGSQSKTEQDEPDPDADGVRRDLKGVAHDEDYCANASDPFFKSGKNRGQWKKRVGVTAESYDKWYAEQLAAVSEDDDTPTTTAVPPTHDKNNVPYAPGMCAAALHEAGAREGTWVAANGIPLEAFDVWYSAQSGGVSASASSTRTAGGKEFKNFGEFMAWVSENQNAGHIDSSDVDAAYAAAGLTITEAVDPANAPRLTEVYNQLSAKTGG